MDSAQIATVPTVTLRNQKGYRNVKDVSNVVKSVFPEHSVFSRPEAGLRRDR